MVLILIYYEKPNHYIFYRDNLDLEMKIKILRNRDVRRIVTFIPRGHSHVRLYIETEDEAYVFHEATLDGILRSYIDVITHPSRRAIELVLEKLEERKRGYSEYQHLETDREEDEILDEMMMVYYDDRK
jgi:hypothetical protein